MALIMEAAMANDTFRTIAATTSYTLPATNVSGGERVLTNNFTMINSTSDGYYKPCIGGKEGTQKLPEVPWYVKLPKIT